MISPFTLYLILMLDNIKGALVALLFASALPAVICFIVTIVNSSCEYKSEEKYFAAGKKGLKICVPLMVFALLTQALLPSSKQAAAIVIIPAIANNENVQREAGELYQLAKQGLKQLVTSEAPAQKE